MPEFLTKLQDNLKEFWQNLENSQKKRIYITSGILLLAITIGIILLTRTTYVSLIKVEDADDAKAIQKALDDEAIKYVPGKNGELMVDAKDKNKAEFALAAAGLTSAGMTFSDAWGRISISSTESDKKKLWENFKKTSIIEKLKMFDNVKDADVELALPEQSAFFTSSEQEKTTAFVRIKPKGEITAEQVQGIIRVVSSSIVGLSPENVTVVDSNFNILNGETGDSALDRTSTKYKMRLKVKAELENSIKRLYPAGSDNFDYINVVANPVLDFNKIKSQTSDIQNPTNMESGALISTQKTQEKLVNDSAGDVPGVDTNPPAGANGTTTYPTGTGENSSYDKKTETSNYEYKKILTEEEKSLGDIDYAKSSMTVTLWYGQRVLDGNKISEEFINQLKNDVSGATGIPTTKISVNKYKIAAPEVIKTAWTDVMKSLFETYGYFVLMMMLIAGLLIAVMKKKSEENEVLQEEPLTEMGPAVITPEDEIQEIEYEEKSEVKKQIEKFVKEKPDAVASLLKNWLNDDWE